MHPPKLSLRFFRSYSHPRLDNEQFKNDFPVAAYLHIVDYEDKGNLNDIMIFPVVNVGAGLKIRAGSNFIIAEITPTGNKSGTCINLGYSF